MSEKPTTTTKNIGTRKGPKIAALVVVLIVASITLFTVIDVEDVDAKSSISFSKSVVNIKDNSFDTVIATFSEVNPGDSVNVSSSSNAVSVVASTIENQKSTITVTSGTISSTTGKVTATITVQLNDQTTSPPSKTFTVNVTVGVNGVEIVNESGQSIAGKKITLDTKEEKTVKVKFTPSNAYNKEVTWTSNDTSVVTVEDGKLKALKEGTAKIKATSKDNTLKSDEITVEVKNVHVTGITLEPKEISINMNYSKKLTATIKPKEATILDVEVTTDKPSLVNVKTSQSGNVITITVEGKVAEKTDTATITVKTKDGGKTATSTVTVVRNAVKSVTLNDDAEELEVDETYDKLIATIDPDYATNKKVSWSTSNSAVAAVDENGHVKAMSPGTAIVTVKTDEGGFTDSCEITVVKTYTIMGSVNSTGIVLNPDALVPLINEAAAKGLYPSLSIEAEKNDSITIDTNVIHALQKAKGGEMSIATINGSIYFDENAIENVDASGKTAGVTFTEIPSETYPKFGECYVYEISMTKDGQKHPTSFGSAGPKIAIPHELAEGEDAAKLKVALVYGDGNALMLRNYAFITGEDEETAVVFEPPHMSTFMYMFHDSEYISTDSFDIVFVALFLVLVLALGGGVAFLEFHPVASEKFMNLFDDPNKPPKRPRFPGRSRKNEYDDYYNNDYYR